MSENAHRSQGGSSDDPGRRARDLFSLEAYLEAQFESFKGGPTMADLLAGADAGERTG